jgi:PhnB protein
MAVKPIPEGYTSVTPYLIVKDVDALLRFITAAFGAEVKEEHRLPDGRVMHADALIGDAHIMMGRATEEWTERLGSLLLYVSDADAVYARALQAGGRSLQEMTTHFYGDRSGGVEDPCGVAWWISTRVEEVSPEEMARRMTESRAS